jgi:hypothetical protein
MDAPRHFEAPIGPRVFWLTALPAAVLAAASVVLTGLILADAPTAPPAWALAGPLGALIAWAAVALGARVRGYRVRLGAIDVLRIGRTNTLPLAGLQSVVSNPEAMRRSWKTWGNDGVGAICGRFRNATLGPYRAFATDPARAVVLRWEDRTIVVTPDRPPAFVEAVRRAVPDHP